MKRFQIFVSVVVCLRNKSSELQDILIDSTDLLASLVCDYELIIVDNASSDNSVETLKTITAVDGLPNLQVYALTKEVDDHTAAWVGLENALGDFVVVFNPCTDDLSVLSEMLEKAITGSDVVFANNQQKPKQTLGYDFSSFIFNSLYKWFNGVHLAKDAPQFRVLSKRIINFILQHNQPSVSYRHLPATAGFVKAYINYSSEPKLSQPKKLIESIERGVQLIVSTTRTPMRLVTFLSLFGAGANLLYSLYVLIIGIFAENVAPGWVSMSLQMSGMFFLISLVLLVLAEYILHMASLTTEGPLYHVGQEFTSARMTRLEKLNIETPSFSQEKNEAAS